jgi:hypothetical protein
VPLSGGSLARDNHEKDGIETYTTVWTILVLVQRPQTQSADVAGDVVAWRKGNVRDRVGADEAHFAIDALGLTRIVGRSALEVGEHPW